MFLWGLIKVPYMVRKCICVFITIPFLHLYICIYCKRYKIFLYIYPFQISVTRNTRVPSYQHLLK